MYIVMTLIQSHTVSTIDSTYFLSNIIFKNILFPRHEIKISFSAQHGEATIREARYYKFIEYYIHKVSIYHRLEQSFYNHIKTDFQNKKIKIFTTEIISSKY